MVESERIVVSDESKLNDIFKPDITEGSIADKLHMPKPGDEGVIVRILYAKAKDGSLGVVNIVKNAKFTGGQAEFMNVEKLDISGVEFQMGLGESLKNSIKRMCNSNGWKPSDLPGKVIHITANWYPKIKCNVCHGSGCAKCDKTGNSVVFNTRARLDLMSSTGNVNKKADVF